MNSILIFLLLTQLHSKPLCDCAVPDDLRRAQELNYKSYNLVFLGKILEIDDDATFKIEVLEIFKGNNLKFATGIATSSCSILPSKDEEFWLIYTNIPAEDSIIAISQCSLSRSFKYPYLLNVGDIPPPPPDDPNLQIEHELIFSNYRTEALETLKAEINQLRNWRDK